MNVPLKDKICTSEYGICTGDTFFSSFTVKLEKKNCMRRIKLVNAGDTLKRLQCTLCLDSLFSLTPLFILLDFVYFVFSNVQSFVSLRPNLFP